MRVSNVDHHNRNVVGLEFELPFPSHASTSWRRRSTKWLGWEVLMLIDEISQPSVAEFQAVRIGRLDESICVDQKPVTRLE